jgi:hypothetical protein
MTATEVEYELGPEDHHRIIAAMNLAAENSLFPEWEFHTIFGVNRDTLRSVARNWPKVDFHSSDVRCAVLNSINNLVGYPHRNQALVEETLKADAATLIELYRRVAAMLAIKPDSENYASRVI